MLLALDAILGHKSAHSLVTGPLIAEPKIHKTKCQIYWVFLCAPQHYSIVALFYCLTWSLLLAICDVVCAVGLTVVYTKTTNISLCLLPFSLKSDHQN